MMKWWDQAACKGQPLELFFPERGHSTKQALEFCKKCTVKEECLADALKYESEDFRFGVYGGMSQSMRQEEFDGKKRPAQICPAHGELTEENTMPFGRGRRRCRACFEDLRDRYRRAVTVCKWGHEYTDENTIISPNGRRSCRACARDRSNEWKRKQARNGTRTNHDHQYEQVG